MGCFLLTGFLAVFPVGEMNLGKLSSEFPHILLSKITFHVGFKQTHPCLAQEEPSTTVTCEHHCFSFITSAEPLGQMSHTASADQVERVTTDSVISPYPEHDHQRISLFKKNVKCIGCYNYLYIC
jgi:hypothetical protein